MIKLDKISKKYNDDNRFILNELSLSIHDNELLVILGSSGSGKTTLLKMINRLIEPTCGSIEIDGKNIQSINSITLRRSIGYAFQGVGLFPHMTVEENIAIVLKLLKKSAQECIQCVHRLLTLVNLDPIIFGKKMIHELSGGQQQRVGVARALANNPHYLLMDEPFGALDAITRIALQNELLAIHRKLQKTIVFVTHDIFEAFRLATRIVIMHEGVIHQAGTANEIITNPATDYVRDLIQKPLTAFSKTIDSIKTDSPQ
jgi:osmoprotectant transport system ATP-binding protein